LKQYLLVGILLIGLGGAVGAFDDPLSVSVGASTMGMGRTGITYANPGISGVFTNPALASEIDVIEATSMYVNLMQEVSYLQVGGLYPTPYGKLGLAFIQTGVGGLDYTSGYDSITGNPVIIKTDYYTRLIMPTYSNALNTPFLGRVNYGAGLKLFSQGLTNVSDAASGYDLTLGLAGKLPTGWNWGMVAQNLLPSSMGAKMKWTFDTQNVNYANTPKESGIPATLQLGVGSKVFDDRAYVEFDLEHPLVQSGRPYLLRAGVETKIINNVFWRVGIDQEPIPGYNGETSASIINDLTTGIGFNFGGFAFDYAFHTFNDLPSNNTHFFSLSYIGLPAKAAGKKVGQLPLLAFKPLLGFSTSESRVLVRARVSGANQAFVNNKETAVAGGVMNAEVATDAPPIKIDLKLLSDDGYLSIKRSFTQFRTFSDVPADYWAYRPVGQLAGNGIIGGYPDGTFKPNKSLTRAELVAILMRKAPTPEGEMKEISFKDLPASHWAYNFVKQSVFLNVVSGYVDGTFKPNKFVSRAEAIKIITSFDGLTLDKVMAAKAPTTKGSGESVSSVEAQSMALASGLDALKYTSHFKDILGHWAYESILAAEAGGWLKFLDKDLSFNPNLPMSRGEVSEVVSHTSLLKAGDPPTVLEVSFPLAKVSRGFALLQDDTQFLTQEAFSAQLEGNDLTLTVPRYAEKPEIKEWENNKWVAGKGKVANIGKDRVSFLFTVNAQWDDRAPVKKEAKKVEKKEEKKALPRQISVTTKEVTVRTTTLEAAPAVVKPALTIPATVEVVPALPPVSPEAALVAPIPAATPEAKKP